MPRKRSGKRFEPRGVDAETLGEIEDCAQWALEWLIDNDPEGTDIYESAARRYDLRGLIAAVAENLRDFGDDETGEGSSMRQPA